MLKPHHTVIFFIIVVITAIFSAFGVHNLLTRYIVSNSRLVVSDLELKTDNNKNISPLPKNREGVYILPSVNPSNPIQPGRGTVGGRTACERLDNLRVCLADKKSNLASQVVSPQASGGASIEELCSEKLGALQNIRLQTIQVGCIW